MATDTNHGGESQVTSQEGTIKDQQLLALTTSISTPGHEDGGYTHDPARSMSPRGACIGIVVAPQAALTTTSQGKRPGWQGPYWRCDRRRSRGGGSGSIRSAQGCLGARVRCLHQPSGLFRCYSQGLALTIIQNTIAIKDKIKVLCLRIGTLEKHFEQPPCGERETRLLETLLRYAGDS